MCIFYVESWLRGNGCIPVNFKMEDAATAEISRAQVNISAPPPRSQFKASSTPQLIHLLTDACFLIIFLAQWSPPPFVPIHRGEKSPRTNT